ncbi:MAG: hypothetical protein AAF236_08925 [Verrucomicrobiota bacterium]
MAARSRLYSPRLLFGLIVAAAALTLIGRGWLTWRWDSPIRGLLWSEGGVGALIAWLPNATWESWATTSDQWITPLLTAVGIALLALGLFSIALSLGVFQSGRWLLLIGAALLILDSVGRWVAADFDFGMAIEHALQIVAPIVLFGAIGRRSEGSVWARVIAVATAATFVGHGCYAAGIHPVPVSYQTMTMAILGVSETGALGFLKIAGWLDFVAAAALFVPFARWFGVGYCIIWGLATALARAIAHIDLNAPLERLDPWLFETMVRSPHWMLPLVLMLSWLARRTESASP